MFWKLFLLVTAFWVAIEASPKDGENLKPLPRGYSFFSWKKDVWSLYAETNRKMAYTLATLNKLGRMEQFEQNPEFNAGLRVMNLNRYPDKILHYLRARSYIVEETSLLRKSINLSQNLSSIITNHNGCSIEEISKIGRVAEIFGNQSRIGFVFQSLKDRTKLYCWDDYKNMLHKTADLFGNENLDIVIDISRFVNGKPLVDYSLDRDNAKPSSIAYISEGLVLYLKSLRHPLFEFIDTINRSEIDSVIRGIFEDEILRPSCMYCILLDPIRKYFIHSNTNITLYERLVDFSCNIALFASSHYTTIKSLMMNFENLGPFEIESMNGMLHGAKLANTLTSQNYGSHEWITDVLKLHLPSMESSNIPETLFLLERMKQYEKRPDFALPIYDIRQPSKVIDYLMASRKIIQKTTLLRKTKTVSENLLDIASNPNCISKEFYTIDELAKLFLPHSRMKMLLQKLAIATRTHCLLIYKELMARIIRLIGKDYFDVPLKISTFIDWRSTENYNLILDSPDSISKAIASYLNSLEHPLLEDIELKNIYEIRLIIEQLFEIEVQHPVSTVCVLLNPIRQNYENNETTIHEKFVDFSCALASFAYSSDRKKISEHLIEMIVYNLSG